MASADTLAKELRALSAHYRSSLRTPAEELRWLEDWMTDLADFADETVRLACRRWRREAKRFPVPSELRSLCLTCSPTLASQIARPYRHPSEAEYESLPVEAKVRVQEAKALELYAKAGPMWKNGRAARPEELPERWHRFRKEARAHECEVRRLKLLLRHK
jgi:hypothetical protein